MCCKRLCNMTCGFDNAPQRRDRCFLTGRKRMDLLVRKENVERKALDGGENVLRINSRRGG